MDKPNFQAGFTLMEIVVSTVIFATVVTLVVVLFTYTLKINRKVEALRQVSQATRNFTEFLVREIRNGTIDYASSVDPINCPAGYNVSEGATYVALTSRGGDRECFYLKTVSGVGSIWVTKQAINGAYSSEQINPANITIDPATFRLFVRPVSNPTTAVGSAYPGVQPFVTMVMNITARLNNTDQPAVIPYQTSVSTDNYGIPHR